MIVQMYINERNCRLILKEKKKKKKKKEKKKGIRESFQV